LNEVCQVVYHQTFSQAAHLVVSIGKFSPNVVQGASCWANLWITGDLTICFLLRIPICAYSIVYRLKADSN